MTDFRDVLEGVALAALSIFVIYSPGLAGRLNLPSIRFSLRFRIIFGYGGLIFGLILIAEWSARNLRLLH